MSRHRVTFPSRVGLLILGVNGFNAHRQTRCNPTEIDAEQHDLREPCFIRGAVGGGPSGTLMAMEPAGDSA